MASPLLNLAQHGVEIVGTIDILPAWPTLPALGWSGYARLAQFTLPLVLILFAESWGTVRALALRHGDTVAANRELGALGVANLASMLAQGMPVGAGFSAGAASEAAGATSRLTAVVAALGLAILVTSATGLISLLPEPVLAAVVIAALAHALDPAPFVRLWRLDRDQYVAFGAAAGVLVLGVLNGMLIAIALSLAALIQRLATPRVARLGRLGGTRDYVDLARHPDAVAPPHIAIWRPTQPLFFANAERMLAVIAAGAFEAAGETSVVISLEESYDLDSTALDALLEFDAAMAAENVHVQLARVHDRVRDVMMASGADTLIARSSYRVDDAVATLESADPTKEMVP